MKNLLFAFTLFLLLGCSRDDLSSSTPGVPEHLEFQIVTNVADQQLNQAIGFLGSADDNVLYYAYRSQPDDNAEKIVKYDVSSNSFSGVIYPLQDFVTKELHIVNNDLVVVGGQFVNIYPLSLTESPFTFSHGFQLTRYGSVLADDEIYIFGGDLGGVDADKIKRVDLANGRLETIATLPEPRFWAHGEVVGTKLYIFGGMQQFAGTVNIAEPEIYIYDFSDGSITTEELPDEIHRSFTATYEHLIFVAGQQWFGNDIKLLFGVYDTQTDTFTEVTTSLAEEDGDTIYGMTTIGNQLYIMYGPGNEELGYTIQRVNL